MSLSLPFSLPSNFPETSIENNNYKGVWDCESGHQILTHTLSALEEHPFESLAIIFFSSVWNSWENRSCLETEQSENTSSLFIYLFTFSSLLLFEASRESRGLQEKNHQIWSNLSLIFLQQRTWLSFSSVDR
jgi:hypothetical protein